MDKDLLGLLIGICLLIAFVAYMAYIYFNPDGFGWLALSSAEPKAPVVGTAPDRLRHDPGDHVATGHLQHPHDQPGLEQRHRDHGQCHHEHHDHHGALGGIIGGLGRGQAGGRMTAESNAEDGLTVSLDLPRRTEPEERPR